MKSVRFLVLTLAAAFGCGHPSDKGNTTPAQEAPAAQTPALGASLPSYLVVKVPVDGNGQEQNAKAQTREVSGQTQVADAAAAASVFGQGTSVTVNELDNTSSTQSWGRGWYWRSGYSYGGYGYNNYGGYGYNSYGYGGYWFGRHAFYRYGGYGYGYGYRLAGATSTPSDAEYGKVVTFAAADAHYYVYSRN